MLRLAKAAQIAGIVVSVVVGLGLILVAWTFGDCGVAGGTCPAEPPPIADDDTFRIAAFGGALLVGGPTLLSKPSWRRLGIAVAAALVAGLLAGLMARGSVNG